MHKRSIVAAAAVAAVMMLAVPAAASADVTAAGSRLVSADGIDYTPDPPKEPSLAGSWANAVCLQSAPWINFEVTLTDPDGQSTSNQATLVLSDATHRLTLDLGSLDSGRIADSVLWPGASVDGQGVGDGWPGWVYEEGEWLQTAGNFAWTRGDIRAYIRVNPELEVPLSYPPETSECAGPAGVAGSTATAANQLPATGGTSAALAPLGGVALAAVVAGVVVLLVRRRRHS